MPLRLRLVPLLVGLLAVATTAPPALAQSTGTVDGQVISQRSGEPMASVQVFLDGTSFGSVTDSNGRFTIASVPAGTYSLRAQRIGFATGSQTITVQAGQAVTVRIALTDRAIALDEVVVTGQGSEISRRRLSTNIDVISQEQLRAAPVSRLDQILQTGLPSVQVRLASGQPGTTSVMRGRGPVSASRASTPVIYVDGVRVDNLNSQAALSLNTSGGRSTGSQTSSIADIPLENIERIEYIPGGAATTLYGSDAANGVLQIFTSRGSPGPADLSFETEVGYETPIRKYFHFPQTVDLLYRNALTQRYRVSGRGGSEGLTWSFSGSVHDREGYRIASNASRSYQGRTGLAAAISENLRYDGSFSFGWNHYERTRDGNAGSYTPLWLLEGARIFAFGFNNDLANASPQELAELGSWLAQAEALQNNRIQVARTQTSHSLRWEPSETLSFRALAGLDHRSSNERGIQTNEFLIHTLVVAPGTNDRGTISSYDRSFLGLTLEAGGQHRGDLGPFSVISNIGGQLFRTDDNQSARVATNVRDGSLTVRGAGTTSADDVFITLVNYGAYAQQNWGFDDRYFLEVGIRADGNSAFGDEVGVQYYPKAGVVWDLGREAFYEFSSLAQWIGEVRFRANYGVAGNFPEPYSRDRTVSFASFLGQQAVGFGNPGNPQLLPEKTYTSEFGADFDALQGRLTFGFNWYDARTRDALFLAPSPPSTGEGIQVRNVGEIKNTGIEFQAAATLVRSDRLNLRLNASYNTLENVVTDAGGTTPFAIGGHSAGTIQSVVEQGQPLGVLRGNKATFNANGTVESVTPIAHLGSPLPDRFGTVGLNAQIGNNLRLNASADWQTGARMHSFNRQFRYLHGLDDPLLPPAMLTVPRAANWLAITDQFVEDTDYFKVRNISAQYVVPQHIAQRVARSLELGFSVSNPMGWWTSSFNPETDHSGAQSQGGATVGGFNYAAEPNPRTFLLNVRVRF